MPDRYITAPLAQRVKRANDLGFIPTPKTNTNSEKEDHDRFGDLNDAR